MKVYVASSWRNEIYPGIVTCLRENGHEVFDFRKPPGGGNGFHWTEIDPAWQDWAPEQFRENLDHPLAAYGCGADFAGMNWAECAVMVAPCGRSAHLELGWFIGQGAPTIVLLQNGEPELMYKLVNHLAISMEEVLGFLNFYDAPNGGG